MQLARHSEAAPTDWVRAGLIVVFAVVSLRYAVPPLIVGLPYGWDAVGYAKAARALLEGGNPWAMTDFPVAFAGPPPSLIPFLPFAWMPDVFVGWSWFALGIVSAVYIVRRLELPWYFLLFPPLVSGVCAGSLVVPTMALMVAGGPLLEGASSAVRGYAIVPLLILGRWRAIGVAILAVLVTAPFLAWPAFFAARESVTQYLAANAENLSATAVPVLIPVAVVALGLLGRERTAWLAVPALWPFTQPFYAVIALPVLARMPLVALSLAIPVPGLIVAGLVAQWVWLRLRVPGNVLAASPPVSR